jgi:hypothetical protein
MKLNRFALIVCSVALISGGKAWAMCPVGVSSCGPDPADPTTKPTKVIPPIPVHPPFLGGIFINPGAIKPPIQIVQIPILSIPMDLRDRASLRSKVNTARGDSTRAAGGVSSVTQQVLQTAGTTSPGTSIPISQQVFTAPIVTPPGIGVQNHFGTNGSQNQTNGGTFAKGGN